MDLRKTFMMLTLLLVPLIAEAQVVKTLLCIQDNSSVYYQLFKRSDDGEWEKWEVYITVEHNAIENLYYIGPKKTLDPGVPVTVPEDLALSPPFVTIRINNASETGLLADQKYSLRGKVTLHVGPTGQSIFRVPNHSDHTFNILVKKGDGPILTGEFIATLSPLDNLKVY
jgi:hypothetical protein